MTRIFYEVAVHVAGHLVTGNIKHYPAQSNQNNHQTLCGGDDVIKAYSIKAKLKNITIREHKPYDHLLMHYCIERLLYRLSKSAYCNTFILKGGMLLYTILDEKARATRDVDFP